MASDQKFVKMPWAHTPTRNKNGTSRRERRDVASPTQPPLTTNLNSGFNATVTAPAPCAQGVSPASKEEPTPNPGGRGAATWPAAAPSAPGQRHQLAAPPSDVSPPVAPRSSLAGGLLSIFRIIITIISLASLPPSSPASSRACSLHIALVRPLQVCGSVPVLGQPTASILPPLTPPPITG